MPGRPSGPALTERHGPGFFLPTAMDKPSHKTYVATLIELFTEAKRLCENWPQRDPDLWQRCVDETRAEVLETQSQKEEARRRAAAATGGVMGGWEKSGVAIRINPSESWKYVVEGIADEKYRQANPKYVEACKQAETRCQDLAKRIDFALDPIQYRLWEIPRVRETLLTKNWREIRDTRTAARMLVYCERGDFDRAIDELELLSQYAAATPAPGTQTALQGAGRKSEEKPSETSGTGSLAVSGEQAPGSETGKSSDGPNEPLTIAGLVKWLKVLQSARDSEDKGRITQAQNDLKVHVGSVEQTEDLLREFQSECGPAAHKNKHVEQAIQYAVRIRTKEAPPGNWFWDWMARTDGVTHELERGSEAGKGGPNETPGAEEQPNTKRQKPRGKPPLKDRFTFHPGQVQFDGKDLDLPVGLPITVLQKLVDSFGVPVSYRELDGISGKTAEDNLRAAKLAIVASFQRHKVPCEIRTKAKEGYCLCPKAPQRPARRRRN